MKLIWLTDIHLNFLEGNERVEFYDSIKSAQGDAVLLTGDIAEAPSVKSMLKEMAAYIKKPIYFVLGNHDYYRGQIDEVKKKIIELTADDDLLHWLPAAGPQTLETDVVLLGQDGWADGRYGDYGNSQVRLNDSRFIVDLFQQECMGKQALLKKMQELADSDAQQLHNDLIQVITQQQPKKIIVLTHVPPFKEACLYQGKISDDDYLPYFGSQATGDVVMTVARENTDIEFLVLCGHTHSKAHYQAVDNLSIKVGQAEYYHPAVQEVITV